MRRRRPHGAQAARVVAGLKLAALTGCSLDDALRLRFPAPGPATQPQAIDITADLALLRSRGHEIGFAAGSYWYRDQPLSPTEITAMAARKRALVARVQPA